MNLKIDEVLICKESGDGFFRDKPYIIQHIYPKGGENQKGVIRLANDSGHVCGFYKNLDGLDDEIVLEEYRQRWFIWNRFYKPSEIRKLKLENICNL